MSIHDGTERIIARLRQEFLADVSDRLDTVQRALDAAARERDDAAAIMLICREVHNIKGMGGSFGFPTITRVAHKLEDYLHDVVGLDGDTIADMQAFLDRLAEIAVAGIEPEAHRANEILRALPSSREFRVEEVRQRDSEALLVVPSQAIGVVVGRELAACGYRITRAQTPWHAFELAVATTPDLLITSLVLDQFSGADLVRAIVAMRATAHVAAAVLTSYSWSHPALHDLPAGVGVVRLSHLGDDLADFVSRFEAAKPQPDPALA